MFGVGMPELMVIFVIALLVFGPKELPKIARTLGKAMSELRRASDELREGIQREIDVASREEQEIPSTSPETISPVAVPEGTPAPLEGAVSAGADGQGSPAMADADAILPPATELPSQTVATEATDSGQVTTLEATAHPEMPTEHPPTVEAIPHPPAQPVETRNA